MSIQGRLVLIKKRCPPVEDSLRIAMPCDPVEIGARSRVDLRRIGQTDIASVDRRRDPPRRDAGHEGASETVRDVERSATITLSFDRTI